MGNKLLPRVLLPLLTVAMLITGCSSEETTGETTPIPAVGTATATAAVQEPAPVSAPPPIVEYAENERPAALPTGDEPTPLPTAEEQNGDVQLRILAINDLHGHIATSSDSFGGVGRADYLAANIGAARAEAENSILVSAGDLIGASPLISALFHDEPTIEAMNLMGLEINSVGNHEFDEGPAELQRMQVGGPHPVDGDLDDTPFGGADFQFIAANVIDNATGETVFPPYAVRDFQGIRVAFIGVTLEGTGAIVARSSVAGLTFLDEAETVNALATELREMGIEAIVVLLHEGGWSDGGQSDCGSGLSGPVVDVARRLDGAVDLVVAGHTNDEFVCQVDGLWVTMADTRGRLFTVIDATLDRQSGDLLVVEVENRPNSQDGVTPEPALTELIDKYEALAAPRANAVIGSLTADIVRKQNEAGESPLGDVIADAQLAATSGADSGGAVVAFTNSGGIRADMRFASSGDEANGELTYAEAFAVQPFGNSLVTMSLTGAQLDALLEQQFGGADVESRNVLQVSQGFVYTWDAAKPPGDRVDASGISIDGVKVDPDALYRVTVNSYLADGGSGFSVLTEGTERTGGMIDIDALTGYFASAGAVSPGPQDRITRLN